MTQTSYFWGGSTLGDASLAPYNDSEIANVMEDIHGNFVIPQYFPVAGALAGSELNVAEDPANVGEVTVSAGAAFVGGTLYILDADANLTIDATPDANPAIYWILLDNDTAAQTVRLTVSKGTSAVTPEPPALASNEFPLAWIWVDGAYNPAADLVPDEYVHDARVFKYIGPVADGNMFENMLHNAEFYATSGGANTAPDGWTLVNTPTTSFGSTSRIPRGQWVRLQGAAGEGIETVIPINTQSDIYTIRGYIEIDTSGLEIEVFWQALGGAAVSYVVKQYNIMTSPNIGGGIEGITEFIIRVRAPVTQDALKIRITAINAVVDGYVGAMAVIPGYQAGSMKATRKHELIWLDNALTDGSWTATAYNSAVNTVNLAANFGSTLTIGLRGVILRIRCRDSGSAAAAANFGCGVRVISSQSNAAVATVACNGLPNDSWTTGLAWVPIDPSDINVPIKLQTVATGALTLDVTVEIIGIIT